MRELSKWFTKLKNEFVEAKFNFLHLVLFAYLFFMPVWPKLPIMSVNYTYIALRYEDFFMLLVGVIFLIYVLRGKIKIRDNFFLRAIPLYWLVAIVSVLVGFYFYHTIITLQLGMLHALRRVEYMSIFFIVFYSLQNTKQAKLLLKFLVFVFFFVSFYGIGQKFWGWPAVQTMNPHYSKGYLLTLDANARISSTFGGHYDFAAFIILLMPLALAFFVLEANYYYLVVFITSLLALILTASRVSFVAYVVSVPFFLLFVRKFKLFFFVVILTVLLMPLSDTLTKRISRTFRQELVWVSAETGQAIVPRKITADDLPAGDFVIKDNDKEVNLNIAANSKEAQLVKDEIREVLAKKAKEEGKPLTHDQLSILVEQSFAKLTPVSSVLPDISFATRLQVEWPRAVKALVRSPLIGTGPSSITEATDNDFLRALGEVGLVGFSLFFLIIFKLLFPAFQKAWKYAGSSKIMLASFVFGGGALLTNALYIDVFEASKVAFIAWFIWGVLAYLLTQSETDINKNLTTPKK